MADDAGALLVRSGLVSSSALDDARAKVADIGGTIGEQLVVGGAVDDDDLTNFYKQRLLVPQVNPNTLARLPAKVVAIIPRDVAIELRAIPVSVDSDNNLTIAMSDPSDRHAVDEISSFTGAYVVRAVASQMQIAWCLAHYYGHVTDLGKRLLDGAPMPLQRPTPPPESLRRALGHDTEPLTAIPDDSGPVVELEDLGGVEGSGPFELEEDEAQITIEADEEGTESSEITIEAEEAGRYEPVLEVTDNESKPVPKRRRPAKEDPPELAARAGEVQLATGQIRKIDFDEPSIFVADNLAEENSRIARQVSGEVNMREIRDRPASEMDPGGIFVELGNLDSGPIIYDELQEEESRAHPVLLDRRRGDSGPQPDEDDVVELQPKKGRRDRNTQLGIGIVRATTGVPHEIDPDPTNPSGYDPTRIDAPAAPPRDGEDSGEYPPVAPPSASRATPPPSGQIPFDRVRRAPSDYGDEEPSKPTGVMSAVELDEAVPNRKSDVHLRRRARVVHDEDDDEEWGPPGTTIPPPLLGAIPGAITPPSGIIPIPDMDSAPLIVAPPVPPEPGVRARSASEASISRALESATARVLELIHTLDHTTDRDQIIAVMIAHLAESHRRAGFFAMRSHVLSLFAITPRIPVMPSASLRLDRPSTLQDVVGTRLPYRGPMLDDASRAFLTATLGVCPPEILLVPITVKERVVGVLFGDQRVRHTFDDQLALAARAAGMALESLLKTKRR